MEFRHIFVAYSEYLKFNIVPFSEEPVTKMKPWSAMAGRLTFTKWPKSGAKLVKPSSPLPLIIQKQVANMTQPQTLQMQPIVLRNLIQKVSQNQIPFYKRNYIDKHRYFFLLLLKNTYLKQFHKILKCSYDKNLDSFMESSAKFVTVIEYCNENKTIRRKCILILYGQ